MFDLLIVDDEKIIREGLASSINWGELGFNIIGIAKDGEEALRIYHHKKPHALLLDIKMPGKSGLEVLKEIKEDNPSVEVVLLSGFDDFSFARDGLKLGAFSYILKIDLVDELENVFIKLRDRLLANKKKEEEYKNLLGIKYDFLFTELLEGKDVVLDQLNNNEDISCGVMVVYMGVQNAETIEKVKSIMNTVSIPFLTGRKNGYIIVIYWNKGQNRTFEELLKKTFDSQGEFHSFLVKNKGVAGVGTNKKSINQIPNSYREAMKIVDIMRKDGNFGLCSYEDFYRVEKRKKIEADFSLLKHYFVLGKFGRLIEEVERVVQEVYLDKGFLITDMQVLCLDILMNLKIACQECNIEIDKMISDYIQEIKQFDSIFDLEKYFMDILWEVCQSIEDIKKQGQYNTLYAAQKYVDENFNTAIKMEEVAQSFYMSSAYFSTKFKDLTGHTFSQYIIKKRIEMACQLLEDSKLKIYEIAKQVGYNDEKHFSRLFSDYMGVSPRQYRKNKK